MKYEGERVKYEGVAACVNESEAGTGGASVDIYILIGLFRDFRIFTTKRVCIEEQCAKIQ